MCDKDCNYGNNNNYDDNNSDDNDNNKIKNNLKFRYFDQEIFIWAK